MNDNDLLDSSGHVWCDGWLATDPIEVTHDPNRLNSGGWWAVVATFECTFTAIRFATVRRAGPPPANWKLSNPQWSSSMSSDEYQTACAAVRDNIRDGEVYQANICRILSTPAPDVTSLTGLYHVLAQGNPAPFAVLIDVGTLQIACASPELYLERNGDTLRTGPIKGTGKTTSDLTDKDRAENVMIVDLVRNDLGVICQPGTVTVEQLLGVEHHPGLVHLVSYVAGQLEPHCGWNDILLGTFPPGSVSGAPKSSALRIISDVEPAPRGPYCGGIGFVDADRQRAKIAVGIRTFWLDNGYLHFGTGAGITWGSDPVAEWHETELKAQRLVALANGHHVPRWKHPTSRQNFSGRIR